MVKVLPLSMGGLEQTAIDSLAGTTRGDVLQPGDEGYDDARTVWNGMIDKHPAVIVQCQGAADVKHAVEFASEHEYPVSVKGGGHNVAGRAISDGGITLDLSGMDHVTVDPDERVVHAGAGCRWGDVDHETQAFGLATTGGVDSRTGVGGLTLGGGWGWLARKYGMVVDNLRSVDLVTADGEFVHVDAESHPELFWGIRGGGGNFGVITEFTYDLHEVGPEIMTAQVYHATADMGEALRGFHSFMADAPDPVGGAAILLTVPPMDPFPEDHHGTTAVALVASHCGDLASGESVLTELADVGDPFISVVDAMAYTEFQQLFNDGVPAGGRYYYKSSYMSDLPPDAIDVLVDECATLPGAYTMVALEASGGANNRVPVDATAFPHRDALYNLGIYGGWDDPERDDEIEAWVQSVHEAIRPYVADGAYANYLSRDDDDRQQEAFRGNYDRLAELKRAWDPENRFANNVPIEPTDG